MNTMTFDYVALAVVSVLLIGGALFLLAQATKLRAKERSKVGRQD